MGSIIARLKAWLFPCACFCCSDGQWREPAAWQRPSVDGRTTLHQRAASSGEQRCIGGHEDWWLPVAGCPWCKAAR